MNKKIATLIQALIDEVNEVKGVKDSKPPTDWWKLINWREPEMKTMFDSLSDDTRKLITDNGLCPDCPEKKYPEAPKQDEETISTEPEMKIPCTELLKKEHPDWSDEKIKEQCEQAEKIDAKKKKEEPAKEPEKKEEPVEEPEEEKKKKKDEAKPVKKTDPYEALKRVNRVLKKE